MIMSKWHMFPPFILASYFGTMLTGSPFSAKYGQPDPEKAEGILEGMDTGRDISSEEGAGGQAGVSKKLDKQA
jgi:hypothetical protein